jgi:hypothetical protein
MALCATATAQQFQSALIAKVFLISRAFATITRWKGFQSAMIEAPTKTNELQRAIQIERQVFPQQVPRGFHTKQSYEAFQPAFIASVFPHGKPFAQIIPDTVSIRF